MICKLLAIPNQQIMLPIQLLVVVLEHGNGWHKSLQSLYIMNYPKIHQTDTSEESDPVKN